MKTFLIKCASLRAMKYKLINHRKVIAMRKRIYKLCINLPSDTSNHWWSWKECKTHKEDKGLDILAVKSVQ